jgi:hypothetical protein
LFPTFVGGTWKIDVKQVLVKFFVILSPMLRVKLVILSYKGLLLNTNLRPAPSKANIATPEIV